MLKKQKTKKHLIIKPQHLFQRKKKPPNISVMKENDKEHRK